MNDLIKASIFLLIFPASVYLYNNLTLKDRIDRGILTEERDVLKWLDQLLSYNRHGIHPLSEIYYQLKVLAGSPYGHIKLSNLTIQRGKGKIPALTKYNNYIPFVNISVGSYTRKPAIAIVAGIHGCDWLTVAAAMNIIREFCLGYKTHKKLMKALTWVIIPILNPDGYEATMNDTLMMKNWRKNMFEPNDTTDNCFGVDISQNFEYQWINYNYENASWCDDNYADHPFTQIESKALRDTVQNHLDTIQMFVSLKQKRRAIMYPYSFTHRKPLFSNIFDKITEKAAEAARKKHYRHFDFGHVLKFENTSAGSHVDWIKAHHDVNLTFSFEISDWVDNNKTITAVEVKETNEETFEAIKVISMMGVTFIENNFELFDSGKSLKMLSLKSLVLIAAFLYLA